MKSYRQKQNEEIKESEAKKSKSAMNGDGERRDGQEIPREIVVVYVNQVIHSSTI